MIFKGKLCPRHHPLCLSQPLTVAMDILVVSWNLKSDQLADAWCKWLQSLKSFCKVSDSFLLQWFHTESPILWLYQKKCSRNIVSEIFYRVMMICRSLFVSLYVPTQTLGAVACTIWLCGSYFLSQSDPASFGCQLWSNSTTLGKQLYFPPSLSFPIVKTEMIIKPTSEGYYES